MFDFIFHRFVNPVFYLLPKLHGILKTHCLECVLSRADVIPEIYLHLKTKGFSQIMSHKSAHFACVISSFMSVTVNIIDKPTSHHMLCLSEMKAGSWFVWISYIRSWPV